MRIQICFIKILIFTNSILVMKSLITFSDAKYKRLEKFLKKKLRKAKPVGGNSSPEKRKDIVSDADSKILNEQIGEPDNEFNKFLKSKKRFALDTILVIYFLGSMIGDLFLSPESDEKVRWH